MPWELGVASMHARVGRDLSGYGVQETERSGGGFDLLPRSDIRMVETRNFFIYLSANVSAVAFLADVNYYNQSSSKSQMISSITHSLSPSSSSSFARRSTISYSLSDNALSGACHPCVKFKHSVFSENLSICNASIKVGWMRLRFLVSISELDEKTRSEGTDVAWMGK